MIRLLCLIVTLLVSCSLDAKDYIQSEEIEKQLNEIHKKSQLPGFSVSVVSPDGVLVQSS